jgi:hypothetical protein
MKENEVPAEMARVFEYFDANYSCPANSVLGDSEWSVCVPSVTRPLSSVE